MRHLALLPLLLGCGFEPPDDVPLAPPPEYRVWYAELQRCAERASPDFDRIRWYVADLEPRGYYGYTEGWSVWLDARQMHRKEIVTHEQLHVLIRDRDHTSPYWRTCL